MILDLFGLIMLLALVLIIIGFVFSDWSSMSLIGFSIFFILSIVILNTGLQYESGANIYYNTTSNITSITYVNTDWSDSNTHTIGYLFSVVGFIGMVFVFFATGIGYKWTSALKRW